MKVLFIENSGRLSAGAFHSLISLIEELKEYNVESYVVLPKNVDGIKILEKKNIKYIKMNTCSYSQMISLNANILEKIKMFFKDIIVKISSLQLIKFVKNNQIDIIHENTSVCYIGNYVAKFTGAKHIWHIREFLEEDFECTIWRKERAIKMFNSADGIIAISKAIYDKYSKILKNITIIQNGIDANKFMIKDKKIFQSDIVNILCVGRICDGKGQKILIEAIGKVKQKYNTILYLMLAGKYSNNELKKINYILKKYDIEENVKLLGQCNNIVDLYNHADILCMASKCEAFGRVTVEAMMAGCLIIGANSGGTSELITDKKNGLIFEAENSDDLCEKIYYSITNKNEMIKLAKNGQKYALTNFNSKKNAKEIYNLYTRILN